MMKGLCTAYYSRAFCTTAMWYRVQAATSTASVASQLPPVYGNVQVKPSTNKVPTSVLAARANNSNIFRLVEAYRNYGHHKADVNPLCSLGSSGGILELDPAQYGISSSQEECSSALLGGSSEDNVGTISVQQLVDRLEQCYCGHLTAEFTHLPSASEREWFAATMESGRFHQPLNEEEKVHVCRLLLSSQVWDNFLAAKFPSVKRYGGEGAEAMMAFYDFTFRTLAESGVQEAFVGMAHRGRLNLLDGLLQVPPQLMFQKMRGRPEFNEQYRYNGDVLSHLTADASLQYPSCAPIRVELLANASHLEAVVPIAMGRTRAAHRRLAVGDYFTQPQCNETACDAGLLGPAPVCVQVHGDSALRGQGVIQETLALPSVPHYSVRGAVHVVIDNQIGFTTEVKGHASDVALMARVPIIRVNGDHPESVARAAQLAVSYQQQFGRDVFVDVMCWRRHGHNELDNPRLTNPAMYAVVDAKRSVPDSYALRLVAEGVLSDEQAAAVTQDSMARLSTSHEEAPSYVPSASATQSQWHGLQQCPADAVEVWETGLPVDTLVFLASSSVRVPDSFHLHPHLAKFHVAARLAKLAPPGSIDWATAEAMAFGSLLLQGVGVRLSGQDVARGTFAHRHCSLVDQQTEQRYVPLNAITTDQTAFLEVANSILSEEAVLGFEYGLSINCPDVLHVWEAQFGDFFNGAQIIFDTCLSSGESKWLYQSGLVVLLPHGYDGAGPEHSSCRVERFLSCCHSNDNVADSSDVNWTVAAPTTPAQYFHLLRGQVVRPYRKPLVIVGPKVLLRLPAAASRLDDMAPNTHFLPLIDDPTTPDPDSVRRVVFVSGKHYYTLAAECKKRGFSDSTAIVRLESICPFPAHQLNDVIKKYGKATKLIWSQEEPRNMGAWPFVFPRFLNICGSKIQFAGRDAKAAPAVGVGERHEAECRHVLDQTFA